MYRYDDVNILVKGVLRMNGKYIPMKDLLWPKNSAR